jgi:hypothetical protein
LLQRLQPGAYRGWLTADDQFDGFLRRIRCPHKADLRPVERAFTYLVLRERSEAAPESPAHADRRERPDLVALNQRCRLVQFVERADAAGSLHMVEPVFARYCCQLFTLVFCRSYGHDLLDCDQSSIPSPSMAFQVSARLRSTLNRLCLSVILRPHDPRAMNRLTDLGRDVRY